MTSSTHLMNHPGALFEVLGAAHGVHRSGTKFYEICMLRRLGDSKVFSIRRYGKIELRYTGKGGSMINHGSEDYNSLYRTKGSMSGGYDMKGGFASGLFGPEADRLGLLRGGSADPGKGRPVLTLGQLIKLYRGSSQSVSIAHELSHNDGSEITDTLYSPNQRPYTDEEFRNKQLSDRKALTDAEARSAEVASLTEAQDASAPTPPPVEKPKPQGWGVWS